MRLKMLWTPGKYQVQKHMNETDIYIALAYFGTYE